MSACIFIYHRAPFYIVLTLVGVPKLIEAAREGIIKGISLLFLRIKVRKPELSEIKSFC